MRDGSLYGRSRLCPRRAGIWAPIAAAAVGALTGGTVSGLFGRSSQKRQQSYDRDRSAADRAFAAREAQKERDFQSLTNQAGEYAANAPRLGAAQREQLKKAYPGTNPWEQLGAGGPTTGPAIAAGASGRKAGGQFATQLKMQAQQNATARDIARTQASAQVQSAALGAQASVKASEIASGPGHRQAAVAEQRVMSEIQNLDAGTQRTLTDMQRLTQEIRKTGAEADSATVEAFWKEVDILLQQELTQAQTGLARKQTERVGSEKARNIGSAAAAGAGAAATVGGIALAGKAMLKRHPLLIAASGAAALARKGNIKGALAKLKAALQR